MPSDVAIPHCRCSAARTLLLDGQRFEALFFDLDGILIDSEAAWRAAIEESLAAVGIAMSDSLYALCAGLDTAAGVERVLQQNPACDADPATLCQTIENNARRRLSGNPPTMPGVAELLPLLARHRLPLAVVSASTNALIEEVLRACGWRDYFALVLSSEAVAIGKPHPAVYREAARRLGVKPHCALALEDSLAGVTSAYRAGMRVIAVPSYESERAAIAEMALRVAGDMRELSAWLAKGVAS